MSDVSILTGTKTSKFAKMTNYRQTLSRFWGITACPNRLT